MLGALLFRQNMSVSISDMAGWDGQTGHGATSLHQHPLLVAFKGKVTCNTGVLRQVSIWRTGRMTDAAASYSVFRFIQRQMPVPMASLRKCLVHELVRIVWTPKSFNKVGLCVKQLNPILRNPQHHHKMDCINMYQPPPTGTLLGLPHWSKSAPRISQHCFGQLNLVLGAFGAEGSAQGLSESRLTPVTPTSPWQIFGSFWDIIWLDYIKLYQI
jgi:hypothetical protein